MAKSIDADQTATKAEKQAAAKRKLGSSTQSVTKRKISWAELEKIKLAAAKGTTA